MKRFVYVPSGQVDEEAEVLSMASQLPIRLGENGDGIDVDKVCIVSVPEIHTCNYLPRQRAGFIHVVDYTNEYVSFSKHIAMRVTGEETTIFSPVLRERHTVKFRNRFETAGQYVFDIVNDTAVLASGNFEII